MTLNIVPTTIALLFAAFACANAQDVAPSHHPVRIVEVHDANTDEPIAGADVTDLITKRSMKTTETGGVGLFVPQFVSVDGAVLRITKPGYQAVGPIIVDPTVDSTLVVVMTRIVTSLPAITSTAHFDMNADPGERSGIATRCASKLDACIGQDELAKSPLKNISDFLKASPGVVVKCASGSADFNTESLGSIMGPVRRSRSNGSQAHTTCSASMASLSVPPSRCIPTVFVNGHEQAHAKTTQTITDQIDAAYAAGDVVAIEVFDSFHPRPLRFTGDPLCGAIVIWTKP
jgi:hypothetical protein